MHNKHFFFCMTDQNFGRVIPFTYLKDLSADFFAKYSEEATSYDGLNDILVQKMNFYNGKELEGKDSAGQQKIDAINKQLDGVKDVMKTNLGSCVPRLSARCLCLLEELVIHLPTHTQNVRLSCHHSANPTQKRRSSAAKRSRCSKRERRS